MYWFTSPTVRHTKIFFPPPSPFEPGTRIAWLCAVVVARWLAFSRVPPAPKGSGSQHSPSDRQGPPVHSRRPDTGSGGAVVGTGGGAGAAAGDGRAAGGGAWQAQHLHRDHEGAWRAGGDGGTVSRGCRAADGPRNSFRREKAPLRRDGGAKGGSERGGGSGRAPPARAGLLLAAGCPPRGPRRGGASYPGGGSACRQ